MDSKWLRGILLTVLLVAGHARLALAHQPVCEFADLTADRPWHVPDAAISYAYFGNVHPAGDIDYYQFRASEGQSILLSLSIPAIPDIKEFLPLMALMGPGLPAPETPPDLPADLRIPPDFGAALIPIGDTPRYWFEPFGRRYYWNFDDVYFIAPQTADYTVALWHPRGEIGRYSFVIGQREDFTGSDMDCFMSYGKYWTPLGEDSSPYRDMPDMTMQEHDLINMLDVPAEGAPQARIQLFALARGGYLLRTKTSNYAFTPQLVDQAAVLNQGHAHLYVDGEKVGRVYGEWHRIDQLPEDWQKLTVALNANDHRVFAVDGVAIADTILRSGSD